MSHAHNGPDAKRHGMGQFNHTDRQYDANRADWQVRGSWGLAWPLAWNRTRIGHVQVSRWMV